jgi:hypothetical protein
MALLRQEQLAAFQPGFVVMILVPSQAESTGYRREAE